MSSIERFTKAQLSTVTALVGGPKTFSQLEKETGYNAHWLDTALKQLVRTAVITKLGKKQGYELNPEWKRQNDALVKLLGGVKFKLAIMRADIDTYPDQELAEMGKMLLPYFYYIPALTAWYYRETELYEYLKDRAVRLLSDYFDSITRMNKLEMLREHQRRQPETLNLDKTTFEQAMNELPSIDHMANRAQQSITRLKSRTRKQL